MEFFPHLLIEGMIVSSYALGANTEVISISVESMHGFLTYLNSYCRSKTKWFLGKNILGTGFDCEIYVQRGAGAYICGEETALLESLKAREVILVSSLLSRR
jgi:NADH-quinone oxidoreductase subunit F